jgi:UPF0755 protein
MKYGHGKVTKRKSIKIVLIGIVAAIGLATLTLFIGGNYWYKQQLRPIDSTSTKETVFIVKSGTAASQVAANLANEKLIRNDQAFMWYLRANNLRDSVQAGTYALSPAMSSQEIAATITEGKVQTDLFTILPGKRLDQIKASFIKAGFSVAEVEAGLDPAQHKNHPALIGKPASASLEGYLYPDSYQRTANTTVQQIVTQSLNEMAEALTPAILGGFEEQGLSSHEGVTLASIVIKESSNAKDVKKIAGVFYNRLNGGISLGSDVTYQYIADVTGVPRNANIDSPYNTRKYKGLPPGPISNTNKIALEAVAFPEQTNYLFFVAGDDGTVYFSTTQAEHDALTAKYCIKLCSVY